MATGTGSYVVGQASKIVIHAGKSTEDLVPGLNSMVLPLGFEANYTTVSAFGTPIDVQVVSGLSYSTISCGGNFMIKAPVLAELRQAAINATKLTDVRFYLDNCSFAGLDLINDTEGSYTVGTMSAPSGEKSGVYSGSVDFVPSGMSTLFDNHASGTDLEFLADTGTGATCTDTTNSPFVDAGFVAGQVAYLDHVDSEDPMIVEIESVTSTVLTFSQAVGDEASVPDFTGIAATKISAGAPMKFDDSSAVC